MKYSVTIQNETGKTATFTRDGIENTLDAVRSWMWANLPKSDDVKKCTCNPYILENYGCKCQAVVEPLRTTRADNFR